MVKNRFILLCCLASLVMLGVSFSSEADENRKVYIVYMGTLPSADQKYSPQSHHSSLLEEVLDSNTVENSLVRSYHRSFNGFAAKLTDAEKDKLISKSEVVSVFPSKKYYPQTTRSWEFMGFNEKVKRQVNVESDTIIGVIDTGIWPESPSFDDKGFGPPPKKWKGVCEGGRNFTCNNKIIGARYYVKDDDGARDVESHGTHTASTAAGNPVNDASLYGFAQGTARGGVPSARLSIYKACSGRDCGDDDVLAAFDDAIADGVDILSVSLSTLYYDQLSHSITAIGSFHAMEKGILTVNSAGNGGPDPRSVGSIAPWFLTVGASTMDRKYISKLVLGNGKTIPGSALNSFSMNGTKYPLVYGAAITKNCSVEEAEACISSCFDSEKVKGKILLCKDVLATGFLEAGVAGAILLGVSENPSLITKLPSTVLMESNFNIAVEYYNSEKNPVAEILRTEMVTDTTAPVVADFSSRGPNRAVPDILKPDITAPGVNILAAISQAPITSASDEPRPSIFSVRSGTSMSCPHVAGIAAYVKTFHQDWSPSAIKSALMTTAWPMNVTTDDESGTPYAISEFAYGSGHVNPVKAIDPGLVYDAGKEDYITLLCGMGYENEKIRKITGEKVTCSKGANAALVRNFNSPSLAFQLRENTDKVVFQRTVTNVGSAKSTYKVTIKENPKINVTVDPEVLSFQSLNEKKSFTVTAIGDLSLDSVVSTSLIWSDGTHTVRSPIVLFKDLYLD